jgi:hypothetical protein
MSLRRRLVLGFAFVALALVVGGFFSTMRGTLVDRVDDQLARRRPRQATWALSGSFSWVQRAGD